MAYNKKTIRDIEISGKRLLLRVDYSVSYDDKGGIVDDYKIRASLPTLRHALDSGASVVICSHLGRPDGKFSSNMSLFGVAKHLRDLLGQDVDFVPECVGERATKAKQALRPGQLLLLENLRFDSREEINDDEFAAQLASDCDVFIQDGFAVCYRQHASVDAVTRHLPSVAGLLLETELEELSEVFAEDCARPVVALISGTSLHEKLHVLERAMAVADVVAVGGAMATTLLHAQGVKTGKSAINPEELPLAHEILHRASEQRRDRALLWYLPQDGVVARRNDVHADPRIVDWSANVIADIEAYPKRASFESSQVGDDEMILDIGPFTGAFLAGVMYHAGTVLLCGAPGDVSVHGVRGPVGPFAYGTQLLVEGMTGQFGHLPGKTVVTGDDAVNFVVAQGLETVCTHVSTGGGASFEILAGHSLVGVDALEDK